MSAMQDKNETVAVVPSVEPYNINLLCQPGIDLKCAECGINSFMFHEDFINHMSIKHGISKAYRCPEIGCDRHYGRRSHLIAHVKSYHQKKRNYECDECHKQFYSKQKWKQHCRIHREEREFKCQLCDKAFKQYRGLYSHIKQVHEKIKHYQCGICRKEFYKKYNWESHCRIHGDEREFKCEHCDKAFKQKQGLHKHIQRMHQKIRNYQCDICHKEFFDKSEWRSHCRIHGTERAFKCQHCDKAFKQRTNLYNHAQRVHKKVRNYQCDICRKEFYQKCNWINHMRIHTGEKPFNCSKCGKCFSFKAYRNLHERKHCRA